MSLEKQVALVTGGSRGIGRAVCVRLAKEGADIIINYAGNEAAARETAAQCEAYGVKTLCVQADVSKEEDCDRLFEQAMAFEGKIDILVNNAGITRDNLILRMKPEDFDAVIETNLRGVFLCLKKASRIMLKQKYGRIINLSSIVGLRGNAGQVNYAAAKAGVIGMTKSLAKELAAKNVTVNAVAPGMIATEMTGSLPEKAREEMLSSIPCKRAGEPEDVANAVSFFADPASGYITGQVLCIDGGMAV